MYQNPHTSNNGSLGTSSANTTSAITSLDQQQQQQQSMNYNEMQQHQSQPQQSSSSSKNNRKKPYVKITEQPASKALRFRYECEGRSAGSIPGVNSMPENKTYPTIEIVGYKGRAVVVVSCVTKDAPYRPHPHNLVGKEGCKKGVCTLEINSETMRAVFSNLGIQCVKKKDIELALKAREEIRVDPFKTGFSHRFQPSSIDLNSVRLCFQVFMESDQKGRFTQPLPPVVSDPIYDKKAMSDLVICRLCSCSSSVLGNTQIILLCEKVAKEDIAVRFFDEKNGQLIWEAFGEFQHTDVHKQTAITFKTPRYHTLDITEPAKVFIQLRRPSDGVTSEALPFEYVPLDSGRQTFWNLRRNLKRKPDLDIFQQILAVDKESKRAMPLCDGETSGVTDLIVPTAEQQTIATEVINSSSNVADTLPTVTVSGGNKLEEEAKRRSEQEIDTIIGEKVRELEQQENQLQQQQQQQQEDQQRQIQDQQLQLQEEQQGAEQQFMEIPEATANEKITEWMQLNENRSDIGDLPIDTMSNSPPANDEDKAFNDLLDQVVELDEIYTDHMMRRDNYNKEILSELHSMDTCVPPPTNDTTLATTEMDVDDNFDDAATYTSLQIAFKNPINIPLNDIMPPTPPTSHLAPEDDLMHCDLDDAVRSIEQQHIQSPPRPAPPKIKSPHMHVTAAEEEKLPPLPPKRIRKPDNTEIGNSTIEANLAVGERKVNNIQDMPIIIMKTPDQSPPTKRLPPKPGQENCNTLPKQKKSNSGFFSKLFSRRKSKADINSEQYSTTDSKASPSVSRDPSIRHFNLNDTNRSSVRSSKSMQPMSLPCSPQKTNNGSTPKYGKPVGRSVSSVSGKRPAHLNADVIHIPLKGDSANSLPQHHEAYSNASTMTLSNALDRRTVSALQLAEIPISEGNMELVAITDRQSLRNLCEGEFNVQLGPNVDLTEAEHFALYTSIPPQATASEFDENSAYYAAVDAGEILSPEEIARRLTAANGLSSGN